MKSRHSHPIICRSPFWVTRDEWFELSKKTDICITPAYEINEVASDPQVQAREMIVNFEDERVGPIKYLGLPFKLSRTPGSIRLRTPGYGEHTDEILTDLGYNESRVSELHQKGIVG